jgi:putative hydroxymethylpyrimidine transport system permease protein
MPPALKMHRLRHLCGVLLIACGIAGALVGFWVLAYHLSGAQPYLLPAPDDVLRRLWRAAPIIWQHARITFAEILIGLCLGTVIGASTATGLWFFNRAGRVLWPLLIISQAIPVFAIAPLLVLWLGYGMASKIAMAIMIIYFPITSAFYDGLRRTPHIWLELGHSMHASRWRLFRHIIVPAALPAFGSGLRVATASAPIGAIVGEWVGSSAGLGYLMLYANARSQIDLMFAALLVLAVFSITLYGAMHHIIKRMAPWAPHASL